MAAFAARSVRHSFRTAAARISTGLKPKVAPSPFGNSSRKPICPRVFRSPVEISSVNVVSMFPFHTATASALLTSMLSVAPRIYDCSNDKC